MNTLTATLALLLVGAQEPEFVSLTVREAAVFKDGHAFIRAEASVLAKSGWIVTQEVPEAILGSLWVASGDPRVKVESVRSGFVEVEERQPCLTLAEMLEACVGRAVTLLVQDGSRRSLDGVLLSVARRPAAAEAPGLLSAPLEGDVIAIRTASGIEILRRSAVIGIQSRDDLPLDRPVKIIRRRLEVKLGAAPDAGAGRVPLHFAYVQSGLRWIPEYRAELLPDRKVRLALQATLVNDLVDLRDARVSFVAGIPNFLMKGSPSPLSLRPALPAAFQSVVDSQQILSNSVMTQVARYGGRAEAAAPAAAPEPFVDGAAADEFFLYPRDGVTLAKGERASYPVFEGTYATEDVYTLRISPRPSRGDASGTIEELRLALQNPKVVHSLKIRNAGRVPWTTGPALIVRDGRALAQDLMRYTPAGGDALLPMAEVADIAVRIRDVEERRVQNVSIDNSRYTQIFMKGTICLVNHRGKEIPLQVERIVVGAAGAVQNAGTSEALDVADFLRAGSWNSSWRHYGFHVNGLFQASWTLKLAPGSTSDLVCEWSFYR